MSRTFTISPEHGWQAGDRAYCVEGSSATRPTLEVGKVYVVEGVRALPNMVDDAITLRGVALPETVREVWSGRFVKLPPTVSSLRQINAYATRSWSEAYRASTGQAPRPIVTARS